MWCTDRVSPATTAASYPKLSGKGLSTALEKLSESRGARCFQAYYTLRFVSWKQNLPRDFSGRPVVKTVLSLQGVWVKPCWGTKTTQAVWCDQNTNNQQQTSLKRGRDEHVLSIFGLTIPGAEPGAKWTLSPHLVG